MLSYTNGWKGVPLFKSGITANLYKEFLKDFQLTKKEMDSYPFVYVDLETSEIKLLTKLLESNDDELLAMSIASAGNIEILGTN